MTTSRDEILALLEPGPETSAQLAVWVGCEQKAMRKRLAAMAVDGLVKCIGQTRRARWTLTGDQEPPADAQPPKHKRSTTPHQTPANVDVQPSWWTLHANPNTPRDAFVAAAAERDEHMRTNPEWRRYKVTGLNMSELR